MQTRSTIEEQYRASDAEQRLSLYLDCPALRATFIAIEMEALETKKERPRQRGAVGKIIDRLMDLCPACVRTRVGMS